MNRTNRTHLLLTALATIAMASAVILMLPGVSTATGSSEKGKTVFPNPFWEGTEFQLSIPQPGSKIKIDVYNIRGIHVRNLFPGREGADPEDHPPGEYPVPWDGKDKFGDEVVPGIYICVLYANASIVKSVKVIKIDK